MRRLDTRVIVRWADSRRARRHVVVLDAPGEDISIPKLARAGRERLVFRNVPLTERMRVKGSGSAGGATV